MEVCVPKTMQSPSSSVSLSSLMDDTHTQPPGHPRGLRWWPWAHSLGGELVPAGGAGSGCFPGLLLALKSCSNGP